MDMAMQVVGWLKNLIQPTEGFYSLVGQVIRVMDPLRRGMCDEYIQVTAVLHPVPEQAGQQPEYFEPHLSLGILVWTGIVAQAAFQTGKQYPGRCANGSLMNVMAAQRELPLPFRTVFGHRGMIPPHKIKRFIEHTYDIFQVIIGQIAAADDHIHILEAVYDLRTVEHIQFNIADGEDLHSGINPIAVTEAAATFLVWVILTAQVDNPSDTASCAA